MTELRQEESQSENAMVWMRELAATAVDDSPLPDAQVLWWKAQALRRLDQEREAEAPLDLGELVCMGGGIVAALGLLAWLLRLPDVRTMPSFVAAVTLSIGLLGLAAMVTILGTARARKV